MLKSILNLDGAQLLSKKEQKKVKGGGSIKYIAPPQGNPSEVGCNAIHGLHDSCYIVTGNGCFISVDCI